MKRQAPYTTLLLLACLVLFTGHEVQGHAKVAEGRSIDYSPSNSLFDSSDDDRHHPHQQPGKPSKFDYDYGQITRTDDSAEHEAEKIQLQDADGHRRQDADRSTASSTTEATTAEQETMKQQQQEQEQKDKKQKIEDDKCDDKRFSVKCMKMKIESFVRTASAQDVYNVSESVQIVKKKEAKYLNVYNNNNNNMDSNNNNNNNDNINNNNSSSVVSGGASTSLLDSLRRFANSHVLKIKLSDANELAPRMFFGSPALGQNTFLTGFGLGFLAFGIKKLLLPLFIGVQIVKSILIALFLPSIIGSLGKIVGKSVTSFAQSSHSPGLGGGANGQQQQYDDQNYEFKDNAEAYGEDYMARQPLGTLPASAMYDESMLQTTKSPAEIASRFAYVGMNDQSYSRVQAQRYQHQAKRQDYKVFQEIPTSSLMLTNYDPFYSPLLSRLDAVFGRLGHETEGCREYAVCAMYRSPARYAPYSNLVSAQLSRELNELRKPSGDNPDVLRFFRYMKAAKDGQDGVACEAAYADCDEAKGDQTIRQNQAMLATYQDIDKLVHARKL